MNSRLACLCMFVAALWPALATAQGDGLVESHLERGEGNSAAAVNSTPGEHTARKTSPGIDVSNDRLRRMSSALTVATSVATGWFQQEDYCGTWQGLQSGNQTSLSMTSDGIEARPVTRNAGQGGVLLYRRAQPGRFRYVFPGGEDSVIEAMPSGRLRVTNSSGWTDTFERIAACADGSDGGRAAAVGDHTGAFALFSGGGGLFSSSGASTSDAAGALASAITGGPPVQGNAPMVQPAAPPLSASPPAATGGTEPSARSMEVYLAGQEQFSRRTADEAARSDGGRSRLVHNRANDATACIRVEPTGVQQEWGIEGRYRLRNTCGYPISASWCANGAECALGRGNLWTIRAGGEWPIFFADPTRPHIQVGACKAGEARQPPLGQQNVEQAGFSEDRDLPAPAPGVSLLMNHRCD